MTKIKIYHIYAELNDGNLIIADFILAFVTFISPVSRSWTSFFKIVTLVCI